ncbi:hypothetical protein EIP86_011553 [Pleurotus ostreatoroseus]|nr:hypothetical protein EIP86_011553 [Pleurotus ostreatoroseus]
MATLEGKKIIVIGGTSGIGYAVAKGALLSRAAHVLVASSSPDKVKRAVVRLCAEPALQDQQGLDKRVQGEVVDMKDSKAVKAFVAGAGEVDHLVITSGRYEGMIDFKNGDLDSMRGAYRGPVQRGHGAYSCMYAAGVFDDRFWGAAAAAQAAKLRTGGSITFTIGTVLHRPLPNGALATSMTGTLDAFTRALALELAPIRVNVVSPGAVQTELWDALPAEMRAPMIKNLVEKLPVKHVAGPEEVAEAYLFLMKCGYMTGKRIDVEGGALLV